MANKQVSLTPEAIASLLERVAGGECSPTDALEQLKRLPFTDLGFARVDHHRELRSGAPEVIFAPGKSAQQIAEIVRTLIAGGHGVLVTRLDADQAAVLEGLFGREFAREPSAWRYCKKARIGRIDSARVDERPKGPVAVISAGTSDQAVAEEAAETLDFLGVEVQRYSDVGVAGIHRLLADAAEIADASVAVVVAGMEGALPSVVGGMVDLPVIAVPTSVGYGASFGGLAALLAMMNSCSSGVTVVNIDNGFGAAMAAALILRVAAKNEAWSF